MWAKQRNVAPVITTLLPIFSYIVRVCLHQNVRSIYEKIHVKIYFRSAVVCVEVPSGRPSTVGVRQGWRVPAFSFHGIRRWRGAAGQPVAKNNFNSIPVTAECGTEWVPCNCIIILSIFSFVLFCTSRDPWVACRPELIPRHYPFGWLRSHFSRLTLFLFNGIVTHVSFCLFPSASCCVSRVPNRRGFFYKFDSVRLNSFFFCSRAVLRATTWQSGAVKSR